ncbi:MAG: RidA family protein [Alteromonadaceae bacterium]|nr:RidA family protein [Alteromonadaceae bacterium]
MTRKFIESGPGLPNWSNPISHAVVVGKMCFVSGQLSISGDGEYVEGTAAEEATLAFNNVFAALKAAGFDKSDIAYIDIAFSDLTKLDEVNEIYMAIFPDGKRPARTVYEAAKLPFGGKVKIVATAVKD